MLSSMTHFQHVDESVLPSGCDPKLFALTFELRSQRHEIEQSIETNKNKFKTANNNLSLAYTELTNIENNLKKNKDKLEMNKVRILRYKIYKYTHIIKVRFVYNIVLFRY